MSPLEWMAWTTPTAIFFTAIIAMIATMTMLGIRTPSLARKGFLPIATTRGDRLYIGLIISAFIFLAWLAATDTTLYGAAAIAVVWLILVLKWG